MSSINVTIDQSGVYSMIRTFEENLYNAEIFAAREIERQLRYHVFYEVVWRLGRRAGPGFPAVYRDHLAGFMKAAIPIDVVAEGDGYMSVSYDLDVLGGYTELELGAHHQALLAIDVDSLPTTRTGKPKYILHPPRVQLPYEGQELENQDSDTRGEFWEQVIINRDFEYTVGLMRGKSPWTIGELLSGEIPTFEDVAAARVFEAWIPAGVAPEWLWLENGFTEREPRIYPVDFIYTLELITECVASRIYEGALISLVEIAEAAGGAIGVGSKGRPFARASGQFVSYRHQVDFATPDISECLGSI